MPSLLIVALMWHLADAVDITAAIQNCINNCNPIAGTDTGLGSRPKRAALRACNDCLRTFDTGYETCAIGCGTPLTDRNRAVLEDICRRCRNNFWRFTSLCRRECGKTVFYKRLINNERICTMCEDMAYRNVNFNY